MSHTASDAGDLVRDTGDLARDTGGLVRDRSRLGLLVVSFALLLVVGLTLPNAAGKSVV